MQLPGLSGAGLPVTLHSGQLLSPEPWQRGRGDRGWLLTWLGGTLGPGQTLLVGMVESCIPSQHQSDTNPTELSPVK